MILMSVNSFSVMWWQKCQSLTLSVSHALLMDFVPDYATLMPDRAFLTVRVNQPTDRRNGDAPAVSTVPTAILSVAVVVRPQSPINQALSSTFVAETVLAGSGGTPSVGWSGRPTGRRGQDGRPRASPSAPRRY